MLLGRRADKWLGQCQPPVRIFLPGFYYLEMEGAAAKKSCNLGSLQTVVFCFSDGIFLQKPLKLEKHRVALWFQVFKIFRSPSTYSCPSPLFVYLSFPWAH